ncbi:MAG: hypothetical protein Q7T53_13770 [Deltaproteobacteria bacterium]|nr:hypothetical protein [Deltaproteobacteria bacterium]
MIEILLVAVLILLIANIYLSYLFSKRGAEDRSQSLQSSLDAFDKSLSRIETSIKDEFARSLLRPIKPDNGL